MSISQKFSRIRHELSVNPTEQRKQFQRQLRFMRYKFFAMITAGYVIGLSVVYWLSRR